MQNVAILRGSHVTADEILEFGAERIVLATGSRWRRDGIGRANTRPIPGFDIDRRVLTPDDLMEGVSASGPVVVFDDDHYYIGAILAEKLRNDGFDVTLVTPAERASAWTVNTLEQHDIQKHLLELGIELLLNRNAVEYDGTCLTVECTYTGRQSAVPAGSIMTVTARAPNEELALGLAEIPERIEAAKIVSVTSIGDCSAPSTIAAAVYAGHRYAREFELPADHRASFRRELSSLGE
jgi:dimethylamine/trimethylamine dehydrogenase